MILHNAQFLYINQFPENHISNENSLKTVHRRTSATIPVSIMVSICACHARDRGSIPRQEASFLPPGNEKMNFFYHKPSNVKDTFSCGHFAERTLTSVLTKNLT